MSRTKRGQHTSACPKSNRRIKRLEADPRVKGVKFGAIDNARTKYGAGHLKFQRYVEAGLKVNCFMDGAVLTLYVYCDLEDRQEVRSLLDS